MTRKLICKCCNEEHTGNNIRLTGFCFFCYVDRARECNEIKRKEEAEIIKLTDKLAVRLVGKPKIIKLTDKQGFAIMKELRGIR